MQMRILSADDVRTCLSMPEAIDAMRDAFAQLARGRAVLPNRVALESGGGVSLWMPAALPESGAVAGKIVSVYGENPDRGLPVIHAVVLVLDPETGVPLALMDGTWLTALRTGAVGGLGTDLLARPDARVAALFGTGPQAYTQLDALRAVRNIEELRVVSRRPENAQAFVDAVRDRYSISMSATDAESAVRGADVVVTATNARAPVFRAEWLEPGVHVTAVGSFTPEMIEFPPEMLADALVVVDELSAARDEAGELIRAVERGAWRWEDVHAELGALVLGERPGRSSAEQRTLFKSVGLGIQDVAVAARVLDRATADDRGIRVEL